MKEGGLWPPFFSQIRKQQYCVAKKGEMDDKVQKFGAWSARQTEQDGGWGCSPWMARKELLGD